jgi:hypothetical protein
MYENDIMEPIKLWTKGEIRKSNREGEYDHGILYACVKIPQWDPLFCAFNIC